MKSVKARATLGKERCPACTREFTLGLSSTRSGVRCPHCRSAITLPTVDTEAPVRSEAVEGKSLPPLIECLRECQALAVRIGALEETVANHARLLCARPLTPPVESAAPPVKSAGDVPASPGRESVEVSQTTRTESTRSGPKPTVQIVGAIQDPAARERVAGVERILAQAGWATRIATTQHKPTTIPLGFTLSISSGVPRDRLKMIFDAFRTAGLRLKLQLDPARAEDDAVLFIGAADAEE